MGVAILAGARKKFSISISEKSKGRQRYLSKTYGLKAKDLLGLVSSCDTLILAVKPQNIDEVLKEIVSCIRGKKLIISIAAGIATQYISKRLGKKVRIVRAMPNLPAQVQKGITALCKGKGATAQDLATAQLIFQTLGQTVVVKERQMDAVTALSGSGPGYVYLFMEQMIAAGVSLGLKKDVAKKLVVQTFVGSSELVSKQEKDPAFLRERVTSKGGTTQAALDVFAKNKIEKVIGQAVFAAAKRAQALSRSA